MIDMTLEKRDFDKVAATWDEEPARIRMAVNVAGAIADAVGMTPDLNVLDFGCGTGLLTLLLQPHIKSITGVDSSRGMLDRLNAKIAAAKLENVKVSFVDLDNGDTLQGSYDLVVSSMTFHHVREIQPLLAQLYAITAPGGRVAIADLDLDNGQFHHDNTGVFHFGFDRTELKKAFGKAGFVDVRDRTATSMTRPVADGGKRDFSVFLITGRKKE